MLPQCVRHSLASLFGEIPTCLSVIFVARVNFPQKPLCRGGALSIPPEPIVVWS